MTDLSIATHARTVPDRPAVIIAETGQIRTYRELNDNSNRVSQFLWSIGLRRGDAFAILMENNLHYMDLIWAALRSGFYAVPINRYSTPEEVAYIVKDSGSIAIFSSGAMKDKAEALSSLIPDCPHRIIVDGSLDGWIAYDTLLAAHDAEPLAEQWMGNVMPYTSGTTGRPKGVVRPLSTLKVTDEWPFIPLIKPAFDLEEGMIYYAPAPMYHGAPMLFLRATHILGGTVVQVQKFDALAALRHIEQYRITHAQMVPTMFVRLLKLPEEDRNRFNLSSLKSMIHAAAPCPRSVKEEMIDWLGPIIHEYYGATDSDGVVPIRCEEWLQYPGSVGKTPVGYIRICDDDGKELPAGQSGLIYFACRGTPPSYRNDPEKTRAARHPLHDNWVTSGDIGYLNEEGYLFLTDRKAFMIISGGVNIYPQMVEDAMIGHPAIADVAVFGVPNPEMGEEVKAVVELADGIQPSDALAAELMTYVSDKVSKYMLPKTLEFIDKLPRTPTGKLLKKQMRDAYWREDGNGSAAAP